MIPKKNRFSRRLFEKAFRRSRKIKIDDMIFLVSDDHRESHCAVVVSKKNAKSAVQRNRIRRQIYESMRHNLLPHIQQKNVICLYKNAQIRKNSQDYKNMLQKLWQIMTRKY